MKTITSVALSALAATSLTLAACSQPAPVAKPAADTAKIAADVKADVAGLVAAFNAKDIDKAVSHDAPGYVGMFHGQPNVVGVEADRAVTKQQVSDPAAKVAVSDETVDVAASGDMAVYRARYNYDFTDPKTKRPAVEAGNWVIGYRTQPDGSWKMTWAVVSDTAAAAAKPG